MNTDIKNFLTTKEARDWAEYFAKECGCKISYDYYYDNSINKQFPTIKEGRRINYQFMCDYKFGLTPRCRSNIERFVKNDHELRFYLMRKGMSFLYVVRFEPKREPVMTYQQMELSDYAVM